MAQNVPIRQDTGVPEVWSLFSTPYYIRTHRPTYGGRRGLYGCLLAGCDGVLVAVGETRHGSVYRGGPGGCGWVLSVAQCGR